MSYMNETRRGIMPRSGKKGSAKKMGLKVAKVAFGVVDTVASGLRTIHKKR